jgi:dTDP-4-amino-4,6-dideoxygalactose transaminase
MEPIFSIDHAVKFSEKYRKINQEMFVKENLINSEKYSESVIRLSPYQYLTDEGINEIFLAFKRVNDVLNPAS